jgi:hypothetical protein
MIVMIWFVNLLTVYLACMAVIAGAKTFEQIKQTVKVGFLPVMKISWMVSPITLVSATISSLPNISSSLPRNIFLLRHGVCNRDPSN